MSQTVKNSFMSTGQCGTIAARSLEKYTIIKIMVFHFYIDGINEVKLDEGILGTSPPSSPHRGFVEDLPREKQFGTSVSSEF